jgi:hypothetical protein
MKADASLALVQENLFALRCAPHYVPRVHATYMHATSLICYGGECVILLSAGNKKSSFVCMQGREKLLAN